MKTVTIEFKYTFSEDVNDDMTDEQIADAALDSVYDMVQTFQGRDLIGSNITIKDEVL
jgi:hypothetical protein